MFLARGLVEDCPSEPGLSVRSPSPKRESARERERNREKGGGEAKMWLCANRTQRHSETLAVLFFRSESGD